MSRTPQAVLFDLDGVLVDTAELHYRSWAGIARQLGIPFDRAANEPLRGLGRMESLHVLLGGRAGEFGAERKQALCDAKNEAYLRFVDELTAADLLPGVTRLLDELAARRVPLAVASSSRNARVVLERLGIAGRFAAVIDGNDAPRSKPDPQVFLVAAERLGVAAADCVVVEDAASGVEAGLAAGMRVVGVGPPERVGRAHSRVAAVSELSAADLVGDEV